MSVKRRDERGEIATTLLVAPTLFLLIMTVFQFALIAHARNVAEAAAQEAVASASTFDGTAADGQASATAALDTLGPRMLTNRTVDVDRSATTVTVSVTGTPLSFIPFLKPTIVETSTGPIERYVAPESDVP
ncbi:TadE/TadG family type IV pilus assembly protein [Aeromicrobium sp. Sec7.5]|uniref:TadE/TadG family type IV pilus assembly protein n=1 Tax=Aeromicrobium sp. Sec7.5 TaxID=3121276 RepID=UPI002FE44A16